jgi:hypothetical protein
MVGLTGLQEMLALVSVREDSLRVDNSTWTLWSKSVNYLATVRAVTISSSNTSI